MRSRGRLEVNEACGRFNRRSLVKCSFLPIVAQLGMFFAILIQRLLSTWKGAMDPLWRLRRDNLKGFRSLNEEIDQWIVGPQGNRKARCGTPGEHPSRQNIKARVVEEQVQQRLPLVVLHLRLFLIAVVPRRNFANHESGLSPVTKCRHREVARTSDSTFPLISHREFESSAEQSHSRHWMSPQLRFQIGRSMLQAPRGLVFLPQAGDTKLLCHRHPRLRRVGKIHSFKHP